MNLSEKSIGQYMRAFLLAYIVLAGCNDSGPNVYIVSGKVYYKQKPLPYGTVVFYGPDGRQIVGSEIGSNGEYSLRAVEGQHRVTVVAHAPLDLPAGEAVETTKMRIRPQKGMPTVPSQYGNMSTSGLYCNVFPEQNTHDINTHDIKIP